ncbi:hypothetical protein WBP06_17750 [Novosphingobium sp. BL-8H]|uniref:hypothetical protein n=1 Tax=Novosphingobium sp. BL-8H TaxID=3127640 RepID=UPI00375722AF
MQNFLGRDPTVTVMFAVAMLLMLLMGTAAILIMTGGPAFLGLAKVAMLLTGAFALVGIGFGLTRTLHTRTLRKRTPRT